MLFRQFAIYNSHVDQETIQNSQPQHFFVTPFVTTKSAPSDIDPNVHGADVRQVSFSTQNNTPSSGSFTATVVIKNRGTAKAVGVQVFVRPYRGIIIGGVDEGMATTPPHPLPENDFLSQYGQWVAFPDLAPGETSTQSVVFISQSKVSPGFNPNPQITFETEKGKP